MNSDKRILVSVEVHTLLKKQATEEHKTIKDYIEALILRDLGKGDK